jgi:hypothetical protein
MYEEITQNDEVIIKQTLDDGKIWWIPKDERNVKYQEYLAWKNENISKDPS